MKKTIIALLFAGVSFGSCTQTNQQKAEALAKSYLDSTLNDAKSYESIKFSKLDTLNESVYNAPEYIKFEKANDSLKAISDSLQDAAITAIGEQSADTTKIRIQSDSLYAEQRKNLEDQKSFEKNFKGKPTGWVISHTYRAKNAMGALIMTTTLFSFDSGLTKVTEQRAGQ